MKIDSGTVAVVTGAASGIGRALALELGRRDVVLALLDVDADGLAALSTSLRRCSTHVCDVGDPEAVGRASLAVIAMHGAVHLLLNNAGISVAGAIEDLALEDLHKSMAANFWGVVHGCQAFLPHLRATARRGDPAAICTVLSDFALCAFPTKAAYAASKYAARAVTEALRAELHGSGITVTAVYPGRTATALIERGRAVDENKRAREAAFLARGMSPEKVARAIVRALERRRARVLIGLDTRAIDLATRISPNLFNLLVARFWRRIPFL